MTIIMRRESPLPSGLTKVRREVTVQSSSLIQAHKKPVNKTSAVLWGFQSNLIVSLQYYILYQGR